MPSRGAKAIIGLLLALVLLAAGLSAGYYIRSRSSVAAVHQPTPSSSVIAAIPTPTPPRSSDWKFPAPGMRSAEVNGKTFYVLETGLFASEFTYKGFESALVVLTDKQKAYLDFMSDNPKPKAALVFQAVLHGDMAMPEVRTWEGETVYVFKTRSGKLAGIIPLSDGRFAVVLLPL